MIPGQGRYWKFQNAARFELWSTGASPRRVRIGPKSPTACAICVASGTGAVPPRLRCTRPAAATPTSAGSRSAPRPAGPTSTPRPTTSSGLRWAISGGLLHALPRGRSAEQAHRDQRGQQRSGDAGAPAARRELRAALLNPRAGPRRRVRGAARGASDIRPRATAAPVGLGRCGRLLRHATLASAVGRARARRPWSVASHSDR